MGTIEDPDASDRYNAILHQIGTMPYCSVVNLSNWGPLFGEPDTGLIGHMQHSKMPKFSETVTSFQNPSF